MSVSISRGWTAVEFATVLVVTPGSGFVEARKGFIGVSSRRHAFVEEGKKMVIDLSVNAYATLMRTGRVAVTPKAVTYVIVLPEEIPEAGGGTGLVG